MGKFKAKTKEQFIEDANKIHDKKYDYSLSDYKNCKKKVKIVCKKHGIFEQTPDIHIRGCGCPKCGNVHKPTTNQFIEKAKSIHGNRYDYSFVNYIKAHSKVKIKCRLHNIFEQTPTNHLSGGICPKCAGRNKTTKELIDEFNKMHKDRYDYSLVIYKGGHKKIKIICKEHGEFQQTPVNHLKPNNCPKCSKVYKPTTEEFINQCNLIHNNKYDYSKVDYVNNQKKICIICSTHGNFNARASHHLNGTGCPKCQGLYKTNEEFINECKLIHGDIYNYSLIEYIKSSVKVKIICKKHGEFLQTASKHLSGQGCNKCRESKGERTIRTFLEENKINFETQKKFDSCKDIRVLKFDFYLLDYNMCIEFDGEQHFRLSHHYNDDSEKLIDRQKKDNIKTQYCINNNIGLIRIKYDENIIEKLRFFA